MSATLDSFKFSEYYQGAPYVYIKGRQFPVQVMYACEHKKDLYKATINTVLQLHIEETPGDILVFLPGQEDIESMERHLIFRMRQLKSSTEVISDIVVTMIFANLPHDFQMQAFDPPPEGYRKVILATNIAETSLTFTGVKYIVDPGLLKYRLYNAKISCDSLITTCVSQAQARQRAGRAGRVADGKCYRLYTEESFIKLKKNIPAEISRADLIGMTLELKSMGVENIATFDFLDPPC